MGPIKVMGRAVQKVADSIMMTLIGNDSMYIYNVSWVSAPPSPCPCFLPSRELFIRAGGKAEHAWKSLLVAVRSTCMMSS